MQERTVSYLGIQIILNSFSYQRKTQFLILNILFIYFSSNGSKISVIFISNISIINFQIFIYILIEKTRRHNCWCTNADAK